MAKEDYRLYFSERDLPLVYCGKLLDKPVLTVENYCKWYTLYLVMPDGTVETARDRDGWEDSVEEWGDWPIVDHNFDPAWVVLLAATLGAYLDEQSLEIIEGRWLHEVKDQYLQINDPDSKEDRAEYIRKYRGKR